MNLTLPSFRQLRQLTASNESPEAVYESAHLERLWSLLALLSLYTAALFVVMLVSDGPDIGCILMGIAGHVLYATGKTALAWREASWLELARARVRERRLARA
jgi:hypothetical protein